VWFPAWFPSWGRSQGQAANPARIGSSSDPRKIISSRQTPFFPPVARSGGAACLAGAGTVEISARNDPYPHVICPDRKCGGAYTNGGPKLDALPPIGDEGVDTPSGAKPMLTKDR